MDTKCRTCGGDTERFKCGSCDVDIETPTGHTCGSDNCSPKCAGCSEADLSCTYGS